jgi:hypothetical protein
LKINYTLLVIIALSGFANAQGVFAPLNQDYYYLIDRYEIKFGKFAPGIFTSYKPTLRKDIAALADSISKDSTLSKVDRFNVQYLKNDNWEWYPDSLGVGNSKKPIMKHFYTKNNSLYQFKSKNFEIQINPVIDFEQRNTNKDYPLSLNTRGVEVRGMIGKRIGFYTEFTDNQAFVPAYVQDVANTAKAFPGEGFTKQFKTNGYDFFSARGYITFNVIKQVAVQFGHDKNFIGNGYRSMLLSDYSSKYLFLKITTKAWIFNYTNLFADMTGTVVNNNQYNPRRYMAMHQLSINITKRFNIGLFEAIMFDRGDSITGNSGFELNYLNPIIFYREAESYLGSLDKTFVGLDFKWNFLKHFSMYGQFALHEFRLKDLLAQNGSYANKYVWQIGLKYIDVAGIKNLDFQLEHNFARPFAYAGGQVKGPVVNFSNYGQPLAHPLGANFYEFIGILRFQPIKRLSISGKMFFMHYGIDPPGKNYGSDISKNYGTADHIYNNYVGQGITTTTIYTSLNFSYMLFHNFFIELSQTFRSEKSSMVNTNTIFTTIGLRWNIARRLNEF